MMFQNQVYNSTNLKSQACDSGVHNKGNPTTIKMDKKMDTVRSKILTECTQKVQNFTFNRFEKVQDVLEEQCCDQINIQEWKKSLLRQTCFKQITRYLPDAEKLLEKVQGKEVEVKEIVKALQKGDWKSPIFNDMDTFPLLALAALKNGQITSGQFSTVMFYWSVRKHHPTNEIQVFSLFNGEEENTEIIKNVTNTFKCPEGSFATKLKYKEKLRDSYHTEEQVRVFLDLVKELPEDEKRFFVVPDIQQPTKGYNEGLSSSEFSAITQELLQGKCTISQEIMKTAGFNIFNRIRIDGKKYRMIPSFGMMQALVTAFAGEKQAVQITSVIGLSSVKDIRNNSLTDTRDMALPFVNVSLPKEADECTSIQEYDFFYHDFYHAYIASCIPPEHRRAFVAIERCLNRLKKDVENPIVVAFLDQFSERIIDMEHFDYRPDNRIYRSEEVGKDESEEIVFWRSLEFQYFNAINRLVIQKMKEAGDFDVDLYEGIQKKAGELAELLAEHEIMRKLAEQWIRTHGFRSNRIFKEALFAYEELLPVPLSDQNPEDNKEFEKLKKANLIFQLREAAKSTSYDKNSDELKNFSV